MNTSKSSVFISGIDDVEKVFSYPHPPVKQMEYQVEVPLLARSDKKHMIIVYPEAFVESVTSNTIPTAVLLPAQMNATVCYSYTVTPVTLKYISIPLRTELMDRLMFCFTCRSPPRFPDHDFSGVTGVTSVTEIPSQRTLTFLRNTKVTPAKLFSQSGVALMFTAV